MRKNINTPSRSSSTVKQNSFSKARSLAAVSGCGLILLTGFFFAAHQHFSSMDYGIRNSRLRKQIDDLRAEKQRLLYTKEVSLSPSEIKKAAKKTGLFNNAAAKPEYTPELASTRTNKQPATPAADPKPTVIKTGSSAPTLPKAVKAVAVIERKSEPQKQPLAK